MRGKKKKCIFAAHFAFALLCNGSTADSGSVCMGSNPIGATKKSESGHGFRFFLHFCSR